MVIMAGMLPGVECARRRRLHRQGAAEAPPCGARRPSLCLHASGGHDRGSSAASMLQGRSSVCTEEMASAWTVEDSNAREAKERLDQKLRGQRQSVVAKKRHQSTGTVRTATATPHAWSTSTAGSIKNLQHASTTAPEAGVTSAAAAPCVLQREVFSEPKNGAGGRRRFSWWCRLGRCGPPPSSTEASAPECAVCLEELRGGDVVARLPCAHRFHWSCAVPWVQGASRCPVCRAQVHLASAPN